MSNGAITAEHVFKKFRRGSRHESLRDAVASWIRLGSSRERNGALQQEEFWALNDVSFEVSPGEAFGIVGPNGAGKSTMLKLLAGILRPNRGSLTINGKVSALIEIGAGFHPDLTGRENIYLNASILGMPRAEVRRKFDEIVDFAEIREFLDTPIKRYSSGMYARLGFAVAAHVAPQVLLVDEVLSVGDRVFRSKCIDKMREFLKQGVAVVFVSHDLSAVSSFCDRALVLSAGKTLYSGNANDAIAHYHKACIDRSTLTKSKGQALVEVASPWFTDSAGRHSDTFAPGEEVQVQFDVRFFMEMQHPSFGLSLIRADDRLVIFETSSTRMNYHAPPAKNGTRTRVRYKIRMNVPPGEYLIGYHVRDRDTAMYADMKENTRIVVAGESVSGGMVDLAPTVETTDISGTGASTSASAPASTSASATSTTQPVLQQASAT